MSSAAPAFSCIRPAFFRSIPCRRKPLPFGTGVCQLRGDELVCDLYCGAGTISLMLARHCRQVLGVEIVPQAIENAKANALHNGIGNVDFHCAPAEELLPRLVERGLRPQVMVVDPPRKGLEPAVIDAMAQAAPERIVYVSCNPATLARDAALLCQRGYTLEKVQSVDMFCWTSGIETVAQFVRSQA